MFFLFDFHLNQIQILADFNKVDILHCLSLIFGLFPELRVNFLFPSNGAALEVKNHFLVLLTLELASVLHNHNVEAIKIVACYCEHPVDSSQQRFVISAF